ncbi:MAG TPA: amino acid ABC transporter permease [Longimicrobiaceae bacterium]
MGYEWDFSLLGDPATRGFLLQGLLRTLQLTAWCIVVGSPLGVLLGSLPFVNSLAGPPSGGLRKALLGGGRGAVLGGQEHVSGVAGALPGALRSSAARIGLQLIAGGSVLLIDVIRAIPLLLLMLTCYYGLPMIAGNSVSGFSAAAIAMTINLAAFVADLVRGAASAVSRGSIMAAQSLGMSRLLTWRRIVLPEVLREILPGLSLLYITMLKMSTLASAIAVYELLHSAEAVIQRTYRPLELYVTVCLLFVVLILPLAWAARRIEQSKIFRRRT